MTSAVCLPRKTFVLMALCSYGPTLLVMVLCSCSYGPTLLVMVLCSYDPTLLVMTLWQGKHFLSVPHRCGLGLRTFDSKGSIGLARFDGDVSKKESEADMSKKEKMKNIGLTAKLGPRGRIKVESMTKSFNSRHVAAFLDSCNDIDSMSAFKWLSVWLESYLKVYIVMAYVVMTYIVMARILSDRTNPERHTHRSTTKDGSGEGSSPPIQNSLTSCVTQISTWWKVS